MTTRKPLKRHLEAGEGERERRSKRSKRGSRKVGGEEDGVSRSSAWSAAEEERESESGGIDEEEEVRSKRVSIVLKTVLSELECVLQN